MTDTRRALQGRRSVVVAAGFAGLASAAVGQGMQPPIPGPFPVLPGAIVVASPPVALAPAVPKRPEAAIRPLFTAPAEAMRLPYWMQPPAPSATEAGTAETAAPNEPATFGGVVAGGVVAGGGGQAGAPRAVPGGGYAVQTPWVGQPAPGFAPGYGAMAAPAGGWGQQPGWGYGAPAGWAPAPYAPQPGWSGWTLLPPEAPR